MSFQQGVAGYAGTDDLHLSIPADFTGLGHPESQYATDPDDAYWQWDFEATTGAGSIFLSSQSTRLGMSDQIGLIRFRDLFGDQPGQIPPGAQITSATLHLQPQNFSPGGLALLRKPGDAANVFEVLVDWDESTRWQTFGPASGADIGVDFASDAIANTGVADTPFAIDVTSSLAAWSQDPQANRGWLFMPSGTQDVITVSGSALGDVTHVTVDLNVDTQQRGELVATLRRGTYSSLLLNRIGAGCTNRFSSLQNGLDITLDDDAAVDVHDSPDDQPLTGSYRPDAACFDFPLCTGGGTGGLCGSGPPDGDWVLNLWDEHSAGASAVLVSWAITLSDGVASETFSSTPNAVIPSRHRASGYAATIFSSENPDFALRPRLEVQFVETAVFSPTSLEALPSAGAVDVQLTLPPGSTDVAALTVDLASDAPGVADPPASLLFPIGVTSLPLSLAIGQAGNAVVSASHAAFGDAALPVSVAAHPIALAPAPLYRAAGAPDETLQVSIPIGSNASATVDVTLTSSDPAVVDPLGATAGALALSFPAGAATTQDVTLQFGSAGSATLTASDDASLLAPGVAAVATSVEEPIEVDVNIAPYVQLGDAPLGAADDQFVLAWQTILRKQGGPNADRFEFEYRRVGDTPWTPVSLEPPVPHGSSSRLNQSVLVDGLDFDEQYEYRLRHLRNEVEIAVHQEIVATRRSDGVRFTAFGNSGQDVEPQHEVAAVMTSLAPDFHLLLGDNVYEAGEYELYKPRVGDPYAALSATNPIHFALGNHDMIWDQGQGAQAYFFTPRNGPASRPTELDYSFDYGPVHFVGVNTGSALGDDILELETAPWLAADLAASTKPWKIVFTHEPPITRDPNPAERKEVEKVRDFLLTTAIEHGADLFVAGGVHSIQRYLPITEVRPEENYVEWAACPQAPGVTPVYAGTGAWFRAFTVTEPLIAPLELYEPGLGLLLVDADADDLTISLIDENGDLLETPVTISQCSAPGACACACGNATLDPNEACDDGNSNSGDGCSSTCLLEDAFGLFGTPVGGFSIDLNVSGVDIETTTSAGQSIHDLVVALANAINTDATLQGLGVTAFSNGTGLITNGSFDSVDVLDPGVMVPEPGALALRAAALAALALLTARRRARRRSGVA